MGKIIIAIVILGFLGVGYAFDVSISALYQPSPMSALVWVVFAIVSFGGICGGLVHALENEKTHSVSVNGVLTDTGVWGHIFIGFCGAYVALAVMLAIFGFDLSQMASKSHEPISNVKYLFYLTAIGIVGGYSGLPIISLISNAALKKVQQEVDRLKTSEQSTKEEVVRLKQNEQELNEKLSVMSKEQSENETQLEQLRLRCALLSAESHAINESYQEAIRILTEDYLPLNSKDAKAYSWLAWCEKRLNNYAGAVRYANKTLEFEQSRLAYFNLACYLCLSGSETHAIMDALHKSWKSAVTDVEKQRLLKGLREDSDLATVRDTKEFKELLEEVEKASG